MVWLPLILNRQLDAELPTLPYQSLYASFGPLIGAVAASAYTGGLAGVQAWASRAFSVRFRAIWWYAAVAMPVAYLLIGYGAARVADGRWPDWAAFGLTDKIPSLGALGVAAVWILTSGLGEESGWRGWLLPTLAGRTSVLGASLIVAVIWITWHVPAFFFNPTYAAMGWGAVGWVIGLVAGSLLLAWMTQQAHWSILPVLIWHAGFDLLTAADQSSGIIAAAISTVVIIQGVSLPSCPGAPAGVGCSCLQRSRPCAGSAAAWRSVCRTAGFACLAVSSGVSPGECALLIGGRVPLLGSSLAIRTVRSLSVPSERLGWRTNALGLVDELAYLAYRAAPSASPSSTNGPNDVTGPRQRRTATRRRQWNTA